MAQSRIERMLNDVRIADHGKLVVLTIAAIAAAVIVAVTSITSSELTAADKAAPSQTGDTAPPQQMDSSSTYLPGQHMNRATEPGEHIQAF